VHVPVMALEGLGIGGKVVDDEEPDHDVGS
jgi:hypothetical protein